MGLWELLVIAVGASMDAFALLAAIGINMIRESGARCWKEKVE